MLNTISHRLPPYRGVVNFIWAQLYTVVNTIICKLHMRGNVYGPAALIPICHTFVTGWLTIPPATSPKRLTEVARSSGSISMTRGWGGWRMAQVLNRRPFFRFFIPFLPLRLTGRALLQKATLLFVRNLLDQIARGNPQCPRQFPKRFGGCDVIGIFENPPDCVVGDV